MKIAQPLNKVSFVTLQLEQHGRHYQVWVTTWKKCWSLSITFAEAFICCRRKFLRSFFSFHRLEANLCEFLSWGHPSHYPKIDQGLSCSPYLFLHKHWWSLSLQTVYFVFSFASLTLFHYRLSVKMIAVMWQSWYKAVLKIFYTKEICLLLFNLASERQE